MTTPSQQAEPEPAELAPCEPGKLTRDEIKTLFLFEKLTDEQLDWIAAHGCTQHAGAGTMVVIEGEPAEKFYVLLSGTIAGFGPPVAFIRRRHQGTNVDVLLESVRSGIVHSLATK